MFQFWWAHVNCSISFLASGVSFAAAAHLLQGLTCCALRKACLWLMCGYLSYYCLPMSSEQSGHSLMTCWNPTDVCEGKSQRVKRPNNNWNYFVQYWNHIIHWFKWQKLGSVIQEEHAATSHQKDLVELVQSSIQDASWGPPRWGVLGMSHQQQASGQT